MKKILSRQFGWIIIVGLSLFCLYNVIQDTYRGGYDDGYKSVKQDIKIDLECRNYASVADSVISERDSTIRLQRKIIHKMVTGEY